VEDVLGDFWLRLVDDDMRWLRAFDPARGGSLLAFLALRVGQTAAEYARRLTEQPTFVGLNDVKRVAAPAPGDARRNTRAVPADVSGLAALLALPAELQALRADVAGLRAAVDQLRRALPPALLSVADAARSLGVAEITVRRMVRTGKLAHVRIGRSVKVDLTRTPVESVNADDGARALLRVAR
jgi:excisionase family DNA binding protein